MIRQGTYITECKAGDLIPCSDAAGEVEEVGDKVKLFKKVCHFCFGAYRRVIGCVPFSIKVIYTET